jgi:hypothetical protein
MRDRVNPIPAGRFIPGYGWYNPSNQTMPEFTGEDKLFLAFMHIKV